MIWLNFIVWTEENREHIHQKYPQNAFDQPNLSSFIVWNTLFAGYIMLSIFFLIIVSIFSWISPDQDHRVALPLCLDFISLWLVKEVQSPAQSSPHICICFQQILFLSLSLSLFLYPSCSLKHIRNQLFSPAMLKAAGTTCLMMWQARKKNWNENILKPVILITLLPFV